MTGSFRFGNRLRHLRRRNRDTQAALAGRMGISASYLNLIENDRRPLTPALLGKLVEAYNLDEQEFLADEPARLRAELTDIVENPMFPGPRLGARVLTELTATLPEAGQALAAVYRAYLDARKEASGLGDRLAGDPYLAAARHRLLTRLTSIRSYSEILRDNVDLAATRRQRFVGVLVDESEQLTNQVNEVFDFLTADGGPGLMPADVPHLAVVDLVRAANNHYPDLEDAAESLRATIAPALMGRSAAMVEALRRDHGVAVEIAEGAESQADAGAAANTLILSEALPQESREFALARRLALAACGPAIERRLAAAGSLPPAVSALYRRALAGYVAAAVMMPYWPFRQRATECRHDLERLQHRFGASFEQVCHRLTTLQRPGAEGIPFHFVRVDIAGNVSKSFSASGLHLPRHGGVCPRWNVHLAFLNAGRIDVQPAQLPGGARYLFIAKALTKPVADSRAPRSHYAVAIGCDVSFARHVIYADGLAVDDPARDVPVGLACGRCPRPDCAQRAGLPPAIQGRTTPMTTAAGPQ